MFMLHVNPTHYHMKSSRLYLPCLAFVTVLFVGCESTGISNRISEKSTVFAALTSKQKQNIQDGIIAPGYTKEMAYMTLGTPTRVETKQADEAEVEMWAYKKFYPSGKLAEIMTAYSRARNSNLLRETNTQTGSVTVSDHAPGNNPGRNSGIGAASGTAGTMNSLSLPDIPVYDLYIFFQSGQVVDIKIESLDGTTF